MADHPWQLTRAQWEAERARLRPCVAQSNFTRNSGAEAVGRTRRLEWLLFDCRREERAELHAAQRGDIPITRERAEELLEILQRPITHADVMARARRLGLVSDGC